MASNNSTSIHFCIPQATGGLAITLQFIALPFHILMIKVLAIDCQLSLPRHKIIFSLSTSDGILILVSFISALSIKVFGLTMNTLACNVFRMMILFTAESTYIVAGLSITFLSIERYIACIHSFQLHQILNTKRVVFALGAIWFVASSAGVVAIAKADYVQSLTAVGDVFVFKVTTVAVVLPTSLVITITQLRLFVLSRSKLGRIHSANTFGDQAELIDLRRRQIKIAFVACIVALAYIACMLPIAILFFYEIGHNVAASQQVKMGFISLSLINTLLDPFIYGFGIVDTRNLLCKQLKKLKDLIIGLRNG